MTNPKSGKQKPAKHKGPNKPKKPKKKIDPSDVIPTKKSKQRTVQYKQPPPPPNTRLPEVDSGDAEVNLAYKKLSKKDSTTKLKGLDELQSTFAHRTCSDLLQLLPTWIEVYRRLAYDNEKRVRELLYAPFTIIATKLQADNLLSELQLYVPEVFTIWRLHQHDPVQEVKRSAVQLWQLVLPTAEQRQQVLTQCQESYFAALDTEYLIPITASSPAPTTPTAASTNSSTSTTPTNASSDASPQSQTDDNNERVERLTFSAIQSLATYVIQLQPATQTEHQSQLEDLLDDVLVQLLVDVRPAIRKATYQLVQTLISKSPQLLLRNVSELTDAVLATIGDTERNNQLTAWQTVITYIQMCQQAQVDVWTVSTKVRTASEGSAGDDEDEADSSDESSDGTDDDAQQPTNGAAPPPGNRLQHFVDKSLLPSVRTAGFGLGTSLYPYCLPMLSLLPMSASSQTTSTPLLPFTYIQSIWDSRNAQRTTDNIVSATLPNYRPMYDAYYECTQYVIATNLQQNLELSDSVLQTCVVDVVQQQLQVDAPSSSSSSSSQPSSRVLDRTFFVVSATAMTKIDNKLSQQQSAECKQLRVTVWQRIATILTSALSQRPLIPYITIFLQHLFKQRTGTDDSLQLQTAATVFDAALNQFLQAPHNNRELLQLCISLSDMLPLGQLLQPQQSNTPQPTSTAHKLISTLAKLPPADTSALQQYCKLLDAYLASTTSKPDLLTQLLHQLQLRNKPTIQLITTVTTQLLTKHLPPGGHVLFDDIALEQAEQMLQAHNHSELQQYVAFFTTVLQSTHLLSTPVYETLLSSFYDVLGYWLQLSGVWNDGELDVDSKSEKFMSHTGAAVDSIPYVVQCLQVVTKDATMWQKLLGNTAVHQQLAEQIVTSMYWLSSNQYTELAAAALQAWNTLDVAVLQQYPSTVTKLTEQLQQSLAGKTSNPQLMVSTAFQDQWTVQVNRLLQLLGADTTLLQTTINTIIPTHAVIQQLLLQPSPSNTQHALIIHDAGLQLAQDVSLSTLLTDSAPATDRAQLAIDLMACYYHSTYYTSIPPYGSADVDSDNAATLINSAIRSNLLSSTFIEQLAPAAIASSTTDGWMYSRVLTDILKSTADAGVDIATPLHKTLLPTITSKTLQSSTPLQHTLHALSAIPASQWLVDKSNGNINHSLLQIVNGLPDTINMTQNPATALQASSSLSAVASIITAMAHSDIGISNTPAWLLDDYSQVITTPQTPSTSDAAILASFYRSQLRLIHSILQFAGELDDNSSGADNTHRLAVVLSAAQAITFAVGKHYPTNKSTLSRDYMYLEPALDLLSAVHLSLDVTDNSVTDLYVVLLQLLTSPLLSAMSVTRYNRWLTQLGTVAAELTAKLPNAAVEASKLLEYNVDAAAKPSSTSKHQQTTALFSLLAHPNPAIAAAAHSILTAGILYHAHQTVITPPAAAAVDSELEAMLARSNQLAATRESESDLLKQRLNEERESQRKKLYKVVPYTLLIILHSRLSIVDADDSTSAFDRSTSRRRKHRNNNQRVQTQQQTNGHTSSIIPFTGQPTALQLRAHLLCWNIALEFLSNDNKRSERLNHQESIAFDKRSLLLASLRDKDVVSPICDELIEHIAVNTQDDELARINEIDGVDLQMLVPQSPNDVKANALAITKRLVALRRDMNGSLPDTESADDTLYYGQLSSYIYLRTLRTVPALARQWWSTVERGATQQLTGITSTYFSPIIIRNDLQTLTDNPIKPSNDDDEFEINASVSSGTARAVFTHSEVTLALSLVLPPTHPLQPVFVNLDDKLRISGNDTRMNKLRLSIARTLSSADGTLLDAIQLWQQNMSKQFEGLEECPICYSIVSTINHTLPRVECTVCHNKFHSSCLYKWFSSSGNSKCPMCRNVF